MHRPSLPRPVFVLLCTLAAAPILAGVAYAATPVQPKLNGSEQQKTLRAKAEQVQSAVTKKVLDKALANFTSALEIMTRHMQSIRAQVVSAKGLSAAERSSLLATLETDLAWLNDRASATPSATANELKTQAQALQTGWQQIRPRAKRIIGQLQIARVNSLLEKLSTFGDAVEEKIAARAANGKNAAVLERRFQEYERQREAAQQSLARAKAQCGAISDPASLQEQYTTCMQSLRTAKQAITKAADALHAIVRALR